MIGIKGLSIPSSCFYCPLRHTDYSIFVHYCGALASMMKHSEIKTKELKEGRKSNCPLEEIK